MFYLLSICYLFGIVSFSICYLFGIVSYCIERYDFLLVGILFSSSFTSDGHHHS